MKTAGSAVTRRGLQFAYPHGSRHMVCMGSEHMQALEQACLILPEELGRALQEKPETEEIRMRLGRPPTALLCGKEQPLSPRPVDRPQMVRVLEAATGASFHAASTLQQGFVRFRSLRIGVCGEAACSRDTVLSMRNVSSLAIRIPHASDGLSCAFARQLLSESPQHLLVAAPPGAGKTSLLRALIRTASEQGLRVGVADERGELWAADAEGTGFDLGPCSDVLTGLKKLPASMRLLRGMNPEIIAMDEITEPEDLEAVRAILGCGVGIFASVHARDRKDMLSRPLYRRLMEDGSFPMLAVIEVRDGQRRYRVERLTE